MSIEEGKAIKNAEIHFTLNGLITSNDALQPGEKEIIVQQVMVEDKDKEL